MIVLEICKKGVHVGLNKFHVGFEECPWIVPMWERMRAHNSPNKCACRIL